MTVLSESLPPLRYTTTRLRDGTPCANAMSHSICGAANPNVNAVTPPLTNCRREKFMTDPVRLLARWPVGLLACWPVGLIKLVLARSHDQVRESGNALLELRIGAGPRRGSQVLGQRRRLARRVSHR